MRRTLGTLILLWLAVDPGAAVFAAQSALQCNVSTNVISQTGPFRDCVNAPELIPLKGGTLQMGDLVGDGLPYERPVHEVRIGPFAMGRFEVTQSEWAKCVADGACPALSQGGEFHGRYPIGGVSWVQAQAYVGWLSARSHQPYRLPSEAEWEYAARAGSTARYTWGASAPPCPFTNLFDRAGAIQHPEWRWSEACDDGFPGAAPVGSFPANAWGFYDMIGNVWEWVADCWHSSYQGAPNDGSAWVEPNCRKRVNRGGGWGNNLRAMRLSSRDADPPGSSSESLGFRVARSIAMPTTAPDAVIASNVYKASPPTVQQAAPQPQDRLLTIRITLKGVQNWKNLLQHTLGTTEQDYWVSTRLHSDGILYPDNLLDDNMSKRLAIKHQYLARRGLLLLKAENGGSLPRSAEQISDLVSRQRSGMTECMRNEVCAGQIVERTAALEALQDQAIDDLEALMSSPARSGEGRWLYFFGYVGCPSSSRAHAVVHISGERAYDNRRKKLVPWSLDRIADGTASESDRKDLCGRYVATVDTKSGAVSLENLFVPSARGSTTRSKNGQVTRTEEEFTMPQEVQHWAGNLVHNAKSTFIVNANLPANAPLDEDFTVMGNFEGTYTATFSWSFSQVP